jgi:hypothetical protein
MDNKHDALSLMARDGFFKSFKAFLISPTVG